MDYKSVLEEHLLCQVSIKYISGRIRLILALHSSFSWRLSRNVFKNEVAVNQRWDYLQHWY